MYTGHIHTSVIVHIPLCMYTPMYSLLAYKSAFIDTYMHAYILTYKCPDIHTHWTAIH